MKTLERFYFVTRKLRRVLGNVCFVFVFFLLGYQIFSARRKSPRLIYFFTPHWGTGDAEVKTYLLRTKSSKVLPLKSGLGQTIAMHALPAERNFFLEQLYTFPVHSPSFFLNLSGVLLVLAVVKRLYNHAHYNR